MTGEVGRSPGGGGNATERIAPPGRDAAGVRLPVIALALALLAAWPARAVEPQLADWLYSARPLARQARPPAVPPDPIVSPTPGAPALVSWGEVLTVTLAAPAGQAVQGGKWWAALSTRTRAPGGAVVGQPVNARTWLAVLGVEPGPAPGLLSLKLRVPASLPRETYHLEVAGPGGLLGRRVHAVRVLGAPRARAALRFALLGDNQLRDPSTRLRPAPLHSGAFPQRGQGRVESVFRQEMSELAFLDPDFVLYAGDLVFGTDYGSELPEALRALWSAPQAVFLVPGNHDGMALYRLQLKKGWRSEALGSVRCARLVAGRLTADRLMALLECLHGDIRKLLFADLQQDGLDYWRRYLGPLDYAFDLGGYHFAGLNSYSGSTERRHGFVLDAGALGLELDRLGIDLDVTTMDNYGGFATDAQLAWLERDLARAREEGREVVLLVHHDPRGNAELAWGARYHANLPFISEPLGLRAFQEWNFDGPDWDSDPRDGRQAETQLKNSATRLLELIGRHVSWVLTGHIHDDRDARIEPGAELVPGSGLRASRRVRFVRVATGSSTPHDDEGYWGYRMLQAGPDGLAGLVYRPEWDWRSVPAGNLWLEGSGVPDGQGRIYLVANGLPGPAEGLLRAYLPRAAEGYRFSADVGEQPRLVDRGDGGSGRDIYYLRLRVPGVEAGLVPPPAGEERRVAVRAERAQGNRPPEIRLTFLPARPVAGEPVRLDASASRDPEGRPLVAPVWDLGDGSGARGLQVERRFAAGRHAVLFCALDDCGARAEGTAELVVAAPEPARVPDAGLADAGPSDAGPGPERVQAEGCSGCAAGWIALAVIGLAAFALWWWRRRGG
ncbi:MAG: metallophosphoesterase [Deltaproteobacteria bacterium]|nr:metallophosphoesterase [Deltaproteobacteria bacterium]